MEDKFKQYKNIYNNTQISAEADKKIKITLENLPVKRRRKPIGITAAVIFCLCIFSILSTTVFQPKAYSLFKSVFGYFVKDNKLNDNYNKYGKAISKTANNNGIELSIDSIASDSLGVTLGYTLKTDKPLKDMNLGINKLLVNGKPVEFEAITSYYKEVSSDQYVGYEFFKIKELPKDFSLDMFVTNISGISGQWNFKIDTTNSDINKNSFFTDSSLEKISENGKLELSKIISTPLNTYIQLTYKGVSPITDDSKIPYSTVFLMDENNRMVTIEGVKSTLIDKYTYKTEFYIEEYKGMLNKLTIIPYKEPQISKEPRKLEEDNDFYSLKTKAPFIIDGGDIGSIKINSIADTKDKITLNCSTDSIYGELLINSLGLGYDVNPSSSNEVSNFNPIYYNKNTLDRLKTLTNFNNVILEFDKDPNFNKDKYSLVFQKYVKNIKVFPELKITIPIN